MTDTIATEQRPGRRDGRRLVRFRRYNNSDYDPGRGRCIRCLWYVVSLLVFESGWVPFYGLKRWLLRLFGARVGRHVCIKPQVRIKYPVATDGGRLLFRGAGGLDRQSRGRATWKPRLHLATGLPVHRQPRLSLAHVRSDGAADSGR